MSSTSPTQRSLEYVRSRGHVAEVCEQTVRYPDRFHPGKTMTFKRDLFGCVDIVAVKEFSPVLLIQTTTQANQAARIEKIRQNDKAIILLRSGSCKLQVHGWAKKGARGERKLWKLTVTDIYLNDSGELASRVLSESDIHESEEKAEAPLFAGNL